MKIVFSTLKYLPHIGGIEIYVHELAQNMIRLGWKVTVVSADVDCSDIVEEVIENEKIIRIPTKEISKFPILRKKEYIDIIEKEIEDADIVHVNICKLLLKYFTDKKKKYHYRLVLTSHGWLHHTDKNRLIKDIYFKYVVAHKAKYFDSIINVSKQDQLIAERFGIENTIVIMNGVDIYKYSDIVKKEEFDNRFLYWGRIANNKGIYECIVKLAEYKTDFKFYIIGGCEDAGYKAKIDNCIKENRLENKIEFLGRLTDKEIKEYIIMSDIILMPSIHEGFGMTLAECLLSNRPIIANTNDSYKFILNYCKATEYLFDFLDPNSKIEDKIKEVKKVSITPTNVCEFSVENMARKTLIEYKCVV